MQIKAFQISDSINIHQILLDLKGKIFKINTSGLLHQNENKHYIYIFQYGVVAFLDTPDEEIEKELAQVQIYLNNPLKNRIEDVFEIEERPDYPIGVAYNSIYVPRLNEDVIKIAMLNVSKSVTLEYCVNILRNLLIELTNFTGQLEKTGKIEMRSKAAWQFIGKTLNIKNKMITELSILSDPDETWEQEYIDKINKTMSASFDMKNRFEEMEFTFRIIDENLEVFKDFLQHREGNRLEWVVVILIVIEVIDQLGEQIWKFFE